MLRECEIKVCGHPCLTLLSISSPVHCILDVPTIQTFKRGDVVIERGVHTDSMLLVLDGTLETETGRDKFKAIVSSHSPRLALRQAQGWQPCLDSFGCMHFDRLEACRPSRMAR